MTFGIDRIFGNWKEPVEIESPFAALFPQGSLVKVVESGMIPIGEVVVVDMYGGPPIIYYNCRLEEAKWALLGVPPELLLDTELRP